MLKPTSSIILEGIKRRARFQENPIHIRVAEEMFSRSVPAGPRAEVRLGVTQW
jgi:hypothetical protein